LDIWHQELGDSCPSVAVNISVRQLMDHQSFNKILDILSNLKELTSFCRLEVTESVIMTDPDVVIQKLNQLSSLGISLSIDDFGTGYSSLSYLNQYPFNNIKIDQSFIATMLIDQKSERLVSSIIGIAHDLEIATVAEGVETEEQMRRLIALGCHYGQGYFFSQPMNAQDATEVAYNRRHFFINTVTANVG
jgi:EAL domain-containing protein (putative c-di-GMP-specific phosphodiesterase class I)